MSAFSPLDHLLAVTASPSEQEADRLQNSREHWFETQVLPPRGDVPSTLPEVVKGITERSTTWFGLQNDSPVAAFEIRRHDADDLTIQFAVPTKRFERELRNQLQRTVPGIGFEQGVSGIPIAAGETVGGATISLGRPHWFPLETRFSQPPNNSVTSLLHRHAMPQGKIVIQLLFQPIVGRPIREWWWKRRAYKTVGYLRKEKEQLWGYRSATPRERSQANAVERKAATPRFAASLRVLVLGAEELTPSYVKEVTSGYHTFNSLETGQYTAASIVRSIREDRLIDFANSVGNREFARWTNRFVVSTEELAALISIPNQNQENIATAHP